MENIMMYNEKLVAVIKCKGKVLREFDGKVYIPFGSEYSITINNLNVRKALVNVTIDGEDVLNGHSLIVDADSKINLEGFLNGKKVVNKFKFIEKTGKVAKYRGNKAQDGLVRISYRFEEYPVWSPPIVSTYVDNTWYGQEPTFGAAPSAFSSCNAATKSRRVTSNCTGDISNKLSASSYVNEDGITGKGGASDQKFNSGTIGTLENKKHVIVLELKGKTRKSPVDAPVFTRAKFHDCPLCGTRNKVRAKFCSECGNALVMFA